MKDFSAIAVFVLLVGSIPFFTNSGVVLNFVLMGWSVFFWPCTFLWSGGLCSSHDAGSFGL
jgi:hypothetical protein